MKKLLLTVISTLIITVSLFAQSIVTKSGLKVNAERCIITPDRFIFKSVINNNKNYILYSEIDTIKGYINPAHKNDILKINNSVIFISEMSSPTKRIKTDLTDDVYFAPQKLTNKSNQTNANSIQGINFTAGDYLKRAGNRYLTGLTLAFGGGIVTGIGIGSESETAFIAGGLISLSGVIISITGHFQLIKAGNKMNSEAVTISSASDGIGFAINF